MKQITLRDALANSKNVITVELARGLGSRRSRDLLKKQGS
jgi:membrane peptidoglycan carboxypeptidase